MSTQVVNEAIYAHYPSPATQWEESAAQRKDHLRLVYSDDAPAQRQDEPVWRDNVYLAGPISGLTYDEACLWRRYAKTYLSALGIGTISPMRAKQVLQSEGKLVSVGFKSKNPLVTNRGITTRDRRDCTRASLVLANLLGSQKPSIGTMIELGWADSARIPVVAVMEQGNVHEHAMVLEIASFILPTLDEALGLVVDVLADRED